MNKLKCFLLVDDSAATNFFNKTIVQKTDCVDEVIIATNGKEAYDFITVGTIPEIIFLDLNMPVMNGWEFLTLYNKLEPSYKQSVIIFMLGAELSSEEKNKIKQIPQVKEFREKMLTKEIVSDIVTTYFK